MDDVTLRRVRHESEVLAPVLDAAMGVATAECSAPLAGRSLVRHAWFRPGVVRIVMRDELERHGVPEGWEVGGNPGLSGQLLLLNQAAGFCLRVLKASRVNPGGVPHAGHNQARRSEWQNPIPGLELGVEVPGSELHLLLLWDFKDQNDIAAGYTMRIVHPLRPGAYRGRVPCDLSILVDHHGVAREEFPAFPGAAEDEDLFEMELDVSEESGEWPR